jgi:hypothetical protein
MAIQNVNGRNVYVLTPKAPTGKTTSGKNWATLYSDLRWQVWEAQQKNEETKLKLDLQSAEARRAYYDDKIKGLQEQRKQIQSATLKVAGGDKGSGLSEYLRAAEGLERMARSSAGKTVEKVTPAITIDGTFIPEERQTTTTTIQGGTSSAAQKAFEKVLNEYDKGEATAEQVTNAAAAAGVDAATGQPVAAAPAAEPLSLEDQLKAIDTQLEQLYSQKVGAGIISDTDLLNRTQRAFEQNVGVIGQGGGPFGLAPRSRRLAPRVDQPRATAFAQDLAAVGTSEAEARRQLEEDRRALLLRREDIMAAAEVDSEDAVAVIDEQLADVNAQLSQPTIAQRLMADESFVERAPGEFLLREQNREPRAPRPDDSPRTSIPSNRDLDIFKNFALPGVDAAGFQFGGQGPVEVPPVPRFESERGSALGTPGTTSRPPSLEELVDGSMMPAAAAPPASEPVTRQRAAPQFVLPSPDAAGFQLDTSRRAELEALGVSPQAQPVTPGVTVPTVITPMQPSASVSPEQGRENAAADLYASYAPRKINADTGEDILTPLNKLEKEQIFSKWLAEEEVTSTLDDDGAKKWYNNAVKELKGGQGGKAAPPTSKQRKELYSFNVSSDGLKLAQKPKQLARLAKTSLPDDKRPQHIVIVDKLFETNSGKTNAFRLTYDEISRVFANDPKKRTEAHKYLVAKDVLEGNKREPLA